MRAKLFGLVVTSLLLPPCLAQQSLESIYRTTGSAVTAAFEPQRQVLQSSSAVIMSGRKEIAYGIVISPDGFVLTKASEIEAAKDLSMTVDQASYQNARIVAVDATWDVALVKIAASGLTPVTYAPTSAVPQGTWVVANGATSRIARRLLPGIISAKIREIPPSSGPAIGVVLKNDETLEIVEVEENSGAKEAGLQKGDIIVAIDGSKLTSRTELGEQLKTRKTGDIIKLTYRRQAIETTVEVRLGIRGETPQDEMSRNDQMSGSFSTRRSGFPRVLQHDILGNKSIIGGPLLDLDGRCIGMNIARANRAESFAIPVEDLKELAQRLLKLADQAPR